MWRVWGEKRVLVNKPEGNKPLGIARYRWEYNIKTDIKETVWVGVYWMYLTEHRKKWWVVSAVMNI
jgi:hypothetical protein